MLRQILIYACAAAAATLAVRGNMQAQTVTGSPAGPPQTGSGSGQMVSVHEVVPVTATVTLALVNPDGSEQDQQGQYYRSGNGNVREDTPAGSVITDFKAGTITTLNPATNQAIVAPTPGPKGRYVPASPPPATPTVTFLGQTTVEGHPVVKRLITLDTSPGQSAEVWTATG